MKLYDSPVYRDDLKIALDSVVSLDTLRGGSLLIAGATGLIGSFLVDMLLEYNRLYDAAVDIYAVGRSEERLHQRFKDVTTDRLHFIQQDVSCPPTFDVPVDYVIHAASNAYPAAFAGDPVGTILGNVMGTHYLLEYARTHQTKRLLFVSSGEVYGQGDPTLTAFPESYSGYVDPTQARSCYPSSKRTAETLCASHLKQYGLDTVIVRPCHTYGPNVTGSDNRATVQFINNALAGEDIVMKSRGSQMRSYCYVADCCSALLSVLTSGASGQAYNIANREAQITIAGFAKEVADQVGRKVLFQLPTEAEKAEQTVIPYAVLDADKLYNLGWHGAYSIKQGVSHTISVLKDNE